MGRRLTVIAVLAAMVATLTAVAAAGPVAEKQLVAIRSTTKPANGFVLTPLTAGALKSDTGTVSFCCWTQRFSMRNGLKVETTDPEMTLVGKRGTLVLRNRQEYLDVPGGYALFTGTWKVVRGTGDYARLSGGGRVAGVLFPNGDGGRWQREGLLSPR